MARVAKAQADIPPCVNPGCSEPRDAQQGRRICRKCHNKNRNAVNAQRNAQRNGHKMLLPSGERDAMLVGNVRSLAARKGGVRGLDDEVKALEQRNLIDYTDGEAMALEGVLPYLRRNLPSELVSIVLPPLEAILALHDARE